MTQHAIFYFDVGSPTSYLAHRALPKIAEETGAQVVWKPVLLGGIFQATGNATPMDLPAKAKWMIDDLQLWAHKRGTRLEHNPYFPINTLTLQRGAAAYEGSDLFASYVETVFSAMWEFPKNLADPAILEATLVEAGFDAVDFKERVSSPAVKEKLRRNTEEAVQAGAFGCPTIMVGDRMFFGQDRLDFVRETLSEH
ncbi:2-hydroxychromene-2-carboxylate isomerase [Trinickia mobilis]|uniref:2-hydroxychromene-2-carboxylate isomerase n=1 Tax=Trinickia mobilis TaxID=2816356 RepID=UPI001A8C6005|nr:2-hydroxychromene-2-carboxylate isomerase [Trinickia mobilis]